MKKLGDILFLALLFVIAALVYAVQWIKNPTMKKVASCNRCGRLQKEWINCRRCGTQYRMHKMRQAKSS
ncbi:MAG: hypothetical protein CFE21_05850 [Bacteroidetes bacterium B1(2017)]|nr:MAG: hypothetical protein CFE21_05850 [Bacteroidetes bacterium B1(2017)]